MDDSVGRESTDHKWDPYQKHCIKLVTKLSGCCIDENRKEASYIVFDKAQRGITPGQFAAWYEGDEVIGSGVID